MKTKILIVGIIIAFILLWILAMKFVIADFEENRDIARAMRFRPEESNACAELEYFGESELADQCLAKIIADLNSKNLR